MAKAARKNFIDLSKIKAKELPKKTIKANLDGEEREYEIHALSESNRNDLIVLLLGEAPDRLTQSRILCLARGLDIDIATATALLNSESADEAGRVADAVFELTDIYQRAKDAETEEAEKN